MKVAFVFDGLGFGGIERVGIDYIKIFRDMGYDIDVYNLAPNQNEMLKELPDGCKIINYKLSRKECPETYSYGAKRWWWGKYAYPLINIALVVYLFFKKLFFIKRKDKYDIVIAFSGHYNDLTFVANNFIKSNYKICWLHGALAEYLLLSHGYATLYSKIKNLVTLSDWMQQAALYGNRILDGTNIKKIYNPVSISNKKVDWEFVNELKEKYGEFILMVGRFSKQKDQKTVVRAIKILRDKYGINNKLVFVGDGEERISVEKLVSELNLDDVVFFVGSRLDVYNFYAAAKLFVHSSPAEGLPTVILEAMSFGLPIVATNSLPGVEEILKNNTYGLICEVGNEEMMAEKIATMLKDNNVYEHYSRKSKERIKDFLPEKISNELKNFINELV
ncbi:MULTISPECIES: glycosyltransferase [Caloramator]|uniref:Glycosyltransferase involved in cell wall bisynthesis n=1 Tax=Caloramator proteoclasticus DSM 10124 TaxID=1121262 RepID=A0A1M4YEL1_9CLOT|nr:MULTISPECIES: glycosyltransferase [Caloramator]SHF04159.1 Glycosyltransferase involved in cell wall bisynthesis [Caloramator proteoclasticus DSM 10124]